VLREPTHFLWPTLSLSPLAPAVFLPGPRLTGLLSLAFSPDGNMLATGSEDGTVRLWDWNGGAPVPGRLLQNGYGPHDPRQNLPYEVQTRALAFAPDGKTLAASRGSAVWFWDASAGQRKPWPEIQTRGRLV
jgi:WD40 repeat protein